MADDQQAPQGPPDNTVESAFPFLVGGTKASAPARSLGNPSGEFIWRDSLNMVMRDGLLQGWAGFNSDAPTIPTGQIPFVTPQGLGSVAAIPLYIYTDDLITVVVTQSEIWVYYGGTWRNITPTYSIGTVTATNGNTAIVGAGGTTWLTDGIRTNSVITIDGTDYLVASVNNDASITLASNFLGATAAGKTYSIRRTFLGYGSSITQIDGMADVYAVMYNQDLYVAVNGAYNGSRGVSAVIKCSLLYSTAPTSTYIVAADAIHIGGSSATVTDLLTTSSYNERIRGIDVLQDGRVVVAAGPVVFYSSHLDVFVWTAAPGGFTPLAEAQGWITGMGRINSTLTFHHQQGIITADPTGLSDPPLRFQSSAAHIGAIGSRTIKPYLGGEAFLAADGDVKIFDGNTVESMGDHEMAYRINQLMVAAGADSILPFTYWAWVDPRRNDYVLFATDYSLSGPTKFWICQRGERWWPCSTTLVMGAMSGGVGGQSSTTPVKVAVAGSKRGTGNMLRYYREGYQESDSIPTYFVETDDLDCGAPLQQKTPMRAFLWAPVALTSIAVQTREHNAGGGTYTYGPTKSVPAGVPTPYDFIPGQIAAITSSVAHRFKISGTDLRLGIFAFLARFMVNGDHERYG